MQVDSEMDEISKTVQEDDSLSTSTIDTDTVQLTSDVAELETDLPTSDLVPDFSWPSTFTLPNAGWPRGGS